MCSVTHMRKCNTRDITCVTDLPLSSKFNTVILASVLHVKEVPLSISSEYKKISLLLNGYQAVKKNKSMFYITCVTYFFMLY